MNYKVFIYLMISLVVFSCSSWKNQLKVSENKNNVRMNIILDYLSRNTDSSKEYFILDSLESKKNYYVFRIDKNGKFAPRLIDTIGAYTKYFPTDFYEKNNKLFIWHDNNKRLDKKTVAKLQEYNCVDSLYHKDNIIPIMDPKKFQKSMYYFVCKKNILKYKKKKAMWIRPKDYPKLKCY